LLNALLHSVLAPLARLLFRPTIEGRHHVPRTGAVIIASNHLSFIDSMVIPLVAPRPVVFLAKADYFTGRGVKGWLIRAFFTATEAVPVERADHRAAQESLDLALEVLRSGRAFGIYPEGTRSRDGRLYRGRTGVAHLALTSGAPVVPVALIGTDRLQPVGRKLPRLHRITVRFGAPLYFSSVPGEAPASTAARARRAATDDIMAAIAALSGQELADALNSNMARAKQGAALRP
jgi:1-acyl-sn-glycerol-3-phosphate acyltransferase